MPISLFLVFVITLLGSWYESNSHKSEQEIIERSESESVAANILVYQSQIMSYATYVNAAGAAPNYAAFQGYNGDAKTFISQINGAGTAPAGMAWFPGPMPGVQATIAGSSLTMAYNPPTSAQVDPVRVRAALHRLSDSSYDVNQPVHVPPPSAAKSP